MTAAEQRLLARCHSGAERAADDAVEMEGVEQTRQAAWGLAGVAVPSNLTRAAGSHPVWPTRIALRRGLPGLEPGTYDKRAVLGTDRGHNRLFLLAAGDVVAGARAAQRAN